MSNRRNDETVAQLAQKYGFSESAVLTLWQALVRGRGTMAQFSHPELGGNGQWMSGMVMIGDMFNDALKAKVSALCSELVPLVAESAAAPSATSWQSQAQRTDNSERAASQPISEELDKRVDSGVGDTAQDPSHSMPAFAPFTPMAFPAMDANPWWPGDLGTPNAVGAQNDLRYAYFADARRLAVEYQNHLAIYDTLDHHIGGVSQQQSVGQTLVFTSQRGTISLADLPLVSQREPR